MIRLARLYPDSDPNLFAEIKPWANIVNDNDKANELWIDSNIRDCDYFKKHPEVFQGIDRVYFYDFFHAQDYSQHISFEQIKTVAEKFPTVWYTCNALPVENINYKRFDYLWNRTKRAYLDGKPGWKQHYNAKIYKQHPLNFDQRNKIYMSLNHAMTFFRTKLWEKLTPYDNGYKSNVGEGIILDNDHTHSDKRMIESYGFPPAEKYFNDSYISIQIESQVGGNAKDKSIIFTEKTYDHLIQGRLVLNFGPCNFYKILKNDGWRLPIGIDLNFDQIENDVQRFEAYWCSVEQLLNLSLFDMHDLFLLNCDTIQHNYDMLKNKSYDYID